MGEWFQRCVPCGDDISNIPKGKIAEHFANCPARVRRPTLIICAHASAIQQDAFPGIFYCMDEDVFFNLEGEIVPNPYERVAG